MKKMHSFVICAEQDVAKATYLTKLYAEEIGFNSVQQSMIATVVSELATNIVKYAQDGSITIGLIKQMEQVGIEIIAEDHGPGIPNRIKALTESYSTGNSLGLGLPSVRKLMDEYMMDSDENLGTKIVVRKWVP